MSKSKYNFWSNQYPLNPPKLVLDCWSSILVCNANIFCEIAIFCTESHVTFPIGTGKCFFEFLSGWCFFRIMHQPVLKVRLLGLGFPTEIRVSNLYINTRETSFTPPYVKWYNIRTWAFLCLKKRPLTSGLFESSFRTRW